MFLKGVYLIEIEVHILRGTNRKTVIDATSRSAMGRRVKTNLSARHREIDFSAKRWLLRKQLHHSSHALHSSTDPPASALRGAATWPDATGRSYSERVPTEMAFRQQRPLVQRPVLLVQPFGTVGMTVISCSDE